MTRIAHYLTIAVFAAFIAAPVATLAIFGPEDAGEKIKPAALFRPDDTYRNDVGTRMITGSQAGLLAIRARSILDYRLVGYAETSRLISGEGDWLYYKEGMDPCLPTDRIEQALDRFDVMRIVAQGAGIDFRLSISPDKHVAEPDHLGFRAGLMATCSLETAAAWRRDLAERHPAVIDHLAAFRGQPGLDALYYRTDTHWNELGGAIAVRQLAKVYQSTNLPLPSEGEETSRPTDLMKMLRLADEEPYLDYPEYFERELPLAVGKGIGGRTVFVHDSFYDRTKQPLRTLFPDSEFYVFGDDAAAKAIAARPDRLIVNTVERALIHRFFSKQGNWESPIGAGLLEANRLATGTCRFDDGEATPLNAGQVELVLPNGGAPCVAVALPPGDGPGMRLLFPTPDGEYRSERSLPIPLGSSGEERFVLALPAELAGRTVRVDLEGAASGVELSAFAGTR